MVRYRETDECFFCSQATLRKIASACGNDVFRDGNGLDLVEPRLLESFLLCSSKQESYV